MSRLPRPLLPAPLRQSLSDLSRLTCTELTENIEKTINDAVKESVDEVMGTSPVTDPHRRNELSVSLTKDTHRLYFEIERGLNVEIKVDSESAKPEDENARAKLEELKSISLKLQYPAIIGEPILRPSGRSGLVSEGPGHQRDTELRSLCGRGKSCTPGSHQSILGRDFKGIVSALVFGLRILMLYILFEFSTGGRKRRPDYRDKSGA